GVKRSPMTKSLRLLLSLTGCRLASLAAGCLLLRRRPALRARAPRRARPRALAAAARRARRVRDPGCALLRHALVLEGFVLLLVLDVCFLSRDTTTPFGRYGRVPVRARVIHDGRLPNRAPPGPPVRAAASAAAPSSA